MRSTRRQRGGRVQKAAIAVLVLAALAAGLTAGTLGAAPSGGTIDSQRAQIRAIEAEIIAIDGQAQSAASQAAVASERLDRAERSLAANATRLRAAKRDLKLSRARLSDRLVAIYREQPPTLVEVLLSADGLTSAVDAQSQLDRVGEQDQRVLERVRQSRARLARARAALAEERDTAARERRAAAERRATLEDLIGQRRAVLDQAQATLSQLVAAEERRRQAAALAAAQAAEEARLRAVAAPVTSSGGGSGSTPSPAAAAPAAPSTTAPPVSGDVGSRLERIAQCESGGDPTAISPGGQYRGKYQFHPGTWASVGGSGDPAAAPEAEQDRRAAILLRTGGASHWPVCGA